MTTPDQSYSDQPYRTTWDIQIRHHYGTSSLVWGGEAFEIKKATFNRGIKETTKPGDMYSTFEYNGEISVTFDLKDSQ